MHLKNNPRLCDTPVISGQDNSSEAVRLKDGLARNNEAINLAQTLLVHIIDSFNQGIRIINKDFTIQRINHAFAELAGIHPKEAIGKKCWEIFQGPFCHTPDCRLKLILNGEGKIQAEIERQKKDGTTVPCITTAAPFLSPDGELIGIIETLECITERKTLEEKVEESEDRYRALIELGTKIGEAVVMLQNANGKEGVQTFVSDQWPYITGYTKNELLGMSFFDLVITKDRQASLERHRRKMSGKPIPNLFELSIIRKDGTQIPVELTSACTIYNKKPANVVYIRDITERKQTEEKHKAIIETAVDGFWVSNLEGRLLDVNESYCKMLGYTRKELLKLSISDIEAIETPEETIQRIIDSKNQGYTHFETRHKRKDGKLIDIDISANYLDVGEGQFFVFLRDVTERKRIEEELDKYRNHLEELVAKRTAELQEQIRRRIEFTRVLVHELKTPLTAIISSSELLTSELQNKLRLRLARNVYRGACSLDRRIDDLLDLARSEIGKLKINCKSVNPLRLLRDVADEMSAEATKKGQSLVIETPESLPPVLAEKDRIKQVLFNLIGNALKFNRMNGKVTLKARVKDGSVIFEVHDEGQGIADEEYERLFLPYYRLESDRERFSGLGLGLALSKSLVELHQGQIWVKSEKGKGSTFYFSIPLTAIAKPEKGVRT